MVVSFQSHFRKLDRGDPTVVLAADLILQHFDFWKSRDFDFRQAGVDTHWSIALQDSDSVDAHRVDGIKVRDPFDSLD